MAVHIRAGRIGLGLLLTLFALAGCGPSPDDIAACRDTFADQRQRLKADGNPGSKEFTPKMTARWDALYAQFGRQAKVASGEDCRRRVTAMTSEISDLDAVLHKIDDYDVSRMIGGAEAAIDRDEVLRRASFNDYVLITLLRTLRERGAEAQKALASLVARVDAAEPGDEAERAAAMVALYNAAASNAAFADFKEALESIRDYDPTEDSGSP